MYNTKLNELVGCILNDTVLNNGTHANFEIKKIWKTNKVLEDDKIPSFRFSSEITLLIEIITAELHVLKDRSKLKKGNPEQYIAQHIMGLIFYRMIKKISTSVESLKLYLYPYLRETKKQILVEEGMQKQGSTYQELVDVVNCFFADKPYQNDKQDNHFVQLRSDIS